MDHVHVEHAENQMTLARHTLPGLWYRQTALPLQVSIIINLISQVAKLCQAHFQDTA